MRALGWILAVVVLAAGGWWLYIHAAGHPVSTSGEVFPRDPSDTRDAADETASAAKPEPVPAQPAPQPAQPAPQPAETAPAPVQPPSATAVATPSTPAAFPVADSIDRNPPAGMAFGGNGKYQWYRQGDITWRIDTRTGASCINFATMEEWSKPIVSSHGCGRT